jgi:hypothetical protein
VKVADDGSVKVDVVKVADDAWHEARPLGTTAWLVRNDIDINFDIAWKLVLHATKFAVIFRIIAKAVRAKASHG